MSTAVLAKPRVLRLLEFVQSAHPPKTYLVFTALWAFSLLALLAGAAGALRVEGTEWVVALSFFLILLFLRAVDEIKDLAYDRVHNPDRPLVRGDVSVNEVWMLAGAVAALVVLLNLALDWRLAAFAAANMAYGLWLLGLERLSKTFRESIVLNLLVTFPVSAALSVYAYLYLLATDRGPVLAVALPVMLAYVCAALHLEFGRKLKWPAHARPGENGYALALGVPGAVAVCAILGVSAWALSVLSFAVAGAGWLAWLPTIALAPSLFGLHAFFENRQRHKDLKPFFALFLVSFYVANLAVALIAL